jgi:hypothetical protein
MKRSRLSSPAPSREDDAPGDHQGPLLAACRDKRYGEVARLALEAMRQEVEGIQTSDPLHAKLSSSYLQAIEASYDVLVSGKSCQTVVSEADMYSLLGIHESCQGQKQGRAFRQRTFII